MINYENGVCESIRPGKKNAQVHGCIMPAGHKGLHCNGQNVLWMQEKHKPKDATGGEG